MATASSPASPSQTTSVPSAIDGTGSTPQSSLTSPNPIVREDKRKSVTPGPDDANPEDQEEVEQLSEMMCSLVTNTYGETRYIGTL